MKRPDPTPTPLADSDLVAVKADLAPLDAYARAGVAVGGGGIARVEPVSAAALLSSRSLGLLSLSMDNLGE